jgi:hypothetical protein
MLESQTNTTRLWGAKKERVKLEMCVCVSVLVCVCACVFCVCAYVLKLFTNACVESQCVCFQGFY